MDIDLGANETRYRLCEGCATISCCSPKSCFFNPIGACRCSTGDSPPIRSPLRRQVDRGGGVHGVGGAVGTQRSLDHRVKPTLCRWSGFQMYAMYGGLDVGTCRIGGLTTAMNEFNLRDCGTWSLHWRPCMTRVPGSSSLYCPLWIPILLLLLPTAYLLWRDRRHTRGHYQKFGYDLQGNVSEAWTECGEPNGEGATHGQ